MKVTCKICNSEFDNPILLNKHLVKDHNKKPIEYNLEYENVPVSIQNMYEKIKDILDRK